MSVMFNLDVSKIMDNIETANEFATMATATQVLIDSNYYCKFDQGMLIATSLINTSVTFSDIGLTNPDITDISGCGSDLDKGVIVWDTPYAQQQYYFENAQTDKNPNAQMMWFHKAKDVHGDEWGKVYAAAFKKAMK